MTGPTRVISTNEYPASHGILVIENIAEGSGKKTDVIRQIIENMVCPLDRGLVEPADKNTADCDSQEKEAGY